MKTLIFKLLFILLLFLSSLKTYSQCKDEYGDNLFSQESGRRREFYLIYNVYKDSTIIVIDTLNIFGTIISTDTNNCCGVFSIDTESNSNKITRFTFLNTFLQVDISKLYNPHKSIVIPISFMGENTILLVNGDTVKQVTTLNNNQITDNVRGLYLNDTLTIEGEIESFAIGGYELNISEICIYENYITNLNSINESQSSYSISYSTDEIIITNSDSNNYNEEYLIMDNLGRIFKRGKIKSKDYHISTKDLHQGLFIVKILTANKMEFSKFYKYY